MKKFLSALLLLGALASGAIAQTFPLNNVPIGLGPGKTGWKAVPPGANGTCLTIVAGVPTFAACSSFPTPVRAGDIIYWNGSAWVTLPGNNAGTLFLQETSAGVPSWAAVPAAGVTNVATAGIVIGGPITSTGTIGVNATITPQGRLSLTSGVPVPTSNVSGATTVYYTPAVGNLVPITSDGTTFTPTAFAEVSQATTDTTKSPAAVVPWACYDEFAWVDTGPTNRVTRGPPWSVAATITVTIATPAVVSWAAHGLTEGMPVVFTTTGALPTGITAGTVYFVGKSPAAGTFNIATSQANVLAGTLIATSGTQSGVHTGTNNTTVRSTGTALTTVNGIALNNATITNGPAASRGTYVGTICSNGTSTIDFIPAPAPAAGGSPAVFNVWNAYNRSPYTTTVNDSTANWTYLYGGAPVFRAVNNSAGNRILFARGLNIDGVSVTYSSMIQQSATTATAYIGIGLNNSLIPNGMQGFASTQSTAVILGIAPGTYSGLPGLGQHYLQVVEQVGNTGTVTYYGDRFSSFTGTFFQ